MTILHIILPVQARSTIAQMEVTHGCFSVIAITQISALYSKSIL